MAEIIDGRALSNEMNKQMLAETEILAKQGIVPGLVVILVGEDEPSQIYVRNKHKRAEKLGIRSIIERLPETTSEEELLALVEHYNQDATIDGILVQLPLPSQINPDHVILSVDPHKDVDGLHPVNIGRLWLGDPDLIACTPYGIMKMLEHYHISIAGKNAIMIGRSNIVGRPMTALLTNADATVTLAHRYTHDLKSLIKDADIVISAVGQAHFITGEMIKNGAVVIDVGENRDENEKLTGDVDFDSVAKKASFITPVPGGVGPMTITMLMYQTIQVAKERTIDA